MKFHYLFLLSVLACEEEKPNTNNGSVDEAESTESNDSTETETESDTETEPEADPDTDGDGLTDAEEATLGTDASNPDSDGDGLTDGEEVNGETDPLNADSDSDGLTDSAEEAASTDPNNSDSDGDGASDGQEVDANTDPLDSNSYPILLENGDWSLNNPQILSDGCQIQSVLNNFNTDIFAVIPENYSVVNAGYASFEIEISSGNANCPITGTQFTCDTLTIVESVDDLGITLTAELTLTGNLNSNTSMDAELEAYLADCDGSACGLLDLFGVSLPCTVEMSAQGSY